MADRKHTDEVFPVTRWVAIAIVPFLVIAAVLLFAVPERTGELFAWPISPPLSAYLLASAYVGGVWFFGRVVTAQRWHHVRHGFVAVAVFAGSLLAATLLHLDKFSHNLSFVVWLALYATTPFIVAGLWFAQRRVDDGAPDDPDLEIPVGVRAGLVAVGLSALTFGVVLWVTAATATTWWAWDLTPLTARVTGAVLSLTGFVNVWMLVDARWSAFRLVYQAQLASLCAIALSLLLGSSDLHWDRPVTVVFVGLVAVAILSYGAITVTFDARLRRRAGG